MNAVTKTEPQGHILPADPMVNMIERIAMDPGSDLDKLERMLAMKERIDGQNAMRQFADALSEARSTIPPIIKDATVDFTSSKGRTNYKHETLAGIAKVIDPILSKNGLSYRFRTDQGQGGVKVTCIIQHRAGHFEETTLMGGADQSGNKNGFQAIGSAVTYLQRYTLKAALGLSAEVDDDAQSVTESAPAQSRPKPEQPAAPNPEAVADGMIAALRGADSEERLKSIWTSEKFKTDLAWLRKHDAERAAHVEAAKDSRKESLKPSISHDLGDEIPEFEGNLK
ncbi:MAG: ERF family protein [Sulfitobacter litoralis]|uniref:ERF family protein n=1 Tax=Sulfitobacter litoralis TaxID=335975 RepID=UPI0030033043